MPNEYDLSDKAILLLNKKSARRFDKAQRECSLMNFDELNVIKIIRKLYQKLKEDNEEAFLSLAYHKYFLSEPHGENPPDDDWLLDFLEENNPVTAYRYDRELERKRDRLEEGVIASGNKTREFRKGLRFWTQMTDQYADLVSDKATVKAYKDSGVKYVKWITEQDERVCLDCKRRNGMIYPIDKIPAKPHWGCRCHIKPLSNK